MAIVCSAVSRGAFVIFAETSSLTIDAVASFGRTLAVPLITPGGPVDTAPVKDRRRAVTTDTAAAQLQASAADLTGYVVFMRPPYQRVLADVILRYNWHRVFYVYDNSEGMQYSVYLLVYQTYTTSQTISVRAPYD